MAEEREDMEQFLKNVDEVGSIINNLSSQDEEKQKEAMKASDRFLMMKHGESTDITNDDKTVITGNNEMSACQLLQGIELDATERATRRKKRESNAEQLKEKGNIAFKAGQYQDAVDYYSEAINTMKYFTTFYTNRAQAFIKLGNYDAAIDDCKWAIRIDDKCVKAYVHCGRALQKKAHFSEAISYLKNAELIDKKQKDVIKGYISQVKREQLKHDLERMAIEKRDDGHDQLNDVSRIVKALLENKGHLEQCTKMIRQLQKLLENNAENKTIFRVVSGFDCFSEHSNFYRLTKISKSWDFPEQGTFVHEMLNLGKISIADSEYNLESLLDQGVTGAILNLSKNCTVKEVKMAAVTLLHQITQSSLGRERILKYTNSDRCFIDDIQSLVAKEDSVSRTVMGCLNNLSLEDRFVVQYSPQLETITLSVVAQYVTHHQQSRGSPSWKVHLLLVSSSLSTLANFARVKKPRKRLQRNNQLWETSLDILKDFVDDADNEVAREIIFADLGLFLNILTEVSEKAKTYATSIYSVLYRLLVSQHNELLQRTLGILRLLMSYSQEVVECACNKKTYETLSEIVKDHCDDLTTVTYSVKCVAVCTVRNALARSYVSCNDLITYHNLLTSESEVIVGNSALILGSCFEQKEACERFVGSSIVKDLMTVAKDERLSMDVKHNAAIALAKLVKNDHRFLAQLRELHGVEILHSVMKLTER